MARNKAEKAKIAAEKRAFEAVRAFRALTPMLESIVLAMTGRRMRVKPHKEMTFTDGTDIWIKPSLALGDKPNHQLVTCNIRAPYTDKQICPACENRDSLMIHLYHEVSHNIFGSFSEITHRERAEAVRYAVPLCDYKTVMDKIENLPSKSADKFHNYMAISTLVHPFLQYFANLFEDVRVNEALFQSRPGTRIMYSAMMWDYLLDLKKKMKKPDGDPERPKINVQFALGMLYSFYQQPLEHFDEKVYNDLFDDRVQEIIDRAIDASTHHETYKVAVDALKLARELGYFQDSDIPEQNEGGQPGQPGTDGGTPEEVMVVIVCDEGDEMAKRLEAALNGESIEMTPEELERAKEATKLLEKAIKQAEQFDAPSHNISHVEFPTERDDKFHAFSYDHPYSQPQESVLGRALMETRVAFAENDRSGYVRNLDTGRVDSRALAKRSFLENPKVFKKRRKPKRRNYFVVIGMDISGSTSGGSTLDILKMSVTYQAECLARLGIKFAVYAHTGTSSQGGYYYDDDGEYTSSGSTVLLPIIKAPDEPWNDISRQRMRRVSSMAYNLDGHTLEQYRRILEQQRATDRILMYYTDGAMPAENYHEELAILLREIETCKRLGITLMGVGIGCDDTEKYGMDTVRVDGHEDVYKVVKHLQKRLVRV